MKRPTRILFTIPNFITAGSGYALLNVVRRLDRERFAPSIAVLRKGGKLETLIEELGIPLLELPFTVPARPLHKLPGYIWEAAKKFRPYGFEIWHSYHYADDYTEPLIARASGARAWVYTKKNMSWGGRAWHVRTFLATRIAAQNTAMLERFFTHPLVRRKVRLVPRGVETDRFRPGVEPRLQIRSQLGLSRDDFLVGCVAHLLPVKGHPTLIQAVAQVPGAHLALAGKLSLDEEYVARLRALCAELGVTGRVHFLGNVSDVPALHAELDAFVLPTLGRSRMEGCPVALLEAMSCGVPSVATDIPGSQDIIRSGEDGLLVPPEDADALAAALRELLDNPQRRRELGLAARRRVEQAYPIEREVARHEALYREIVGDYP